MPDEENKNPKTENIYREKNRIHTFWYTFLYYIIERELIDGGTFVLWVEN